MQIAQQLENRMQSYANIGEHLIKIAKPTLVEGDQQISTIFIFILYTILKLTAYQLLILAMKLQDKRLFLYLYLSLLAYK